MLTKNDLLKIAYWTNGCMFELYCPILKSKVEFDTYLSSKDQITPRVLTTLNDFLSIPESKYLDVEKAIMDVYNSVKDYQDDQTKLEHILSYCNIHKSDFLSYFIKNDWIQIELLWDNMYALKNNYVNIGFYYPCDSYATYIVFENGKLKTSYIDSEKNRFPSKIYK